MSRFQCNQDFLPKKWANEIANGLDEETRTLRLWQLQTLSVEPKKNWREKGYQDLMKKLIDLARHSIEKEEESS